MSLLNSPSSEIEQWKTVIKQTLVLLGLIAIYTVAFHFLMSREGQDHSWTTGVYWTLTVMSTLGFGDITFQSDAGRLFSIVVLVTGVMFLLVLLPFTFIEFFYAPWMKAQDEAKAPRNVPAGTRNHVILTNDGPVTRRLVHMLDEFGYPHFFVAPTVERTLEMRDKDLPVVVGELSDPDTYSRMNVSDAALVASTLDDVSNTNVTFTVRELSDNVQIVASAGSDSGRDVLDLAGVTEVLRLEKMMGQALARRIVSDDTTAHVIGEIDGLIIAEASPANTPLVNKTIAESGLRAETGATIVGILRQGLFSPADPATTIAREDILVLAGSAEQIERYDDAIVPPSHAQVRVIVAGGGRVGRATSKALTDADVPFTMIEKLSDRVGGLPNVIVGDASDCATVATAGLREAASVIITTHDDDLNVFLAIFYRRLRSDIQIIARCTHERNVARLHRAGANLVLSYASMGANAIFNVLRGSGTLLLADGVNIFRSKIPRRLAGRTLANTSVRSRTNCSIIAVESEGERLINPEADYELPASGTLVLIGSLEAETQFLASYRADLD